MTVYVLCEKGYYGHIGIIGVTTRKDVVEFWESQRDCYVEECEMDAHDDPRVERFLAKGGE